MLRTEDSIGTPGMVSKLGRLDGAIYAGIASAFSSGTDYEVQK